MHLNRTKAALAAYDTWYDSDASDPDQLDVLAVNVGTAFGLDTADRNTPADCVRLACCPSGLDFVRRMVALTEVL